MILSSVSTWALTRLFGSGPVADVAAKGVTYLGRELRGAVARDDLPVTKVRLRPGETYTVVSRPRPSPRERKLAKKQSALVSTYEYQAKASRSQLKAARRLRKAQRRLDRVDPGSRRYARRVSKERRRALEFDQKMRPSKKELRTVTELDRISRELDALRERSLKQARSENRPRRKVSIYS